MKQLCIALLLLLEVNAYASECPHDNPESVLQDLLYDVRLPFTALQYFNMEQPGEARKYLAKDLSNTIYFLNAVLPYPACFENEAEVERTWGMVRVLAIMHERHPVPEWKNDELIDSLFTQAISDNPAHAEELRARDWTRQP